MAAGLLRIVSDLHFGDRASRVDQLRQLAPLLEGVEHLVLNGDTLDTRHGPNPAHTAACRAEVLEFFPRQVPRATFLTGNHDADFSSEHTLDLAGGQVFVVHGDVFFDNIVPWSRDAVKIERLIAAEVARTRRGLDADFGHRLQVLRRVAAALPQRHQSERNRLKYALHYAADTVWPPLRMWRVLKAWRDAPAQAGIFTRRHRPQARFVVSGHTHRPGIWTHDSTLTVINTGSYCAPLGGSVVDICDEKLAVREVVRRRGEFHAGRTLAEFPLAPR